MAQLAVKVLASQGPTSILHGCTSDLYLNHAAVAALWKAISPNVSNDLCLKHYAVGRLISSGGPKIYSQRVASELRLSSSPCRCNSNILPLAQAFVADWNNVKKFKTDLSKWLTWLTNYF